MVARVSAPTTLVGTNGGRMTAKPEVTDLLPVGRQYLWERTLNLQPLPLVALDDGTVGQPCFCYL
jgi:hypothetical protein